MLVTRASAQAKPLCQLIEQSDGTALHYPMLELSATPNDPSIALAKSQLSKYSIIIFISANAVHYGMQVLGVLPENIQLACVGQQTALTLQSYGYQSAIQPTENFSSEGLLALNALQDVDQKSILIVRGNGGRETLKEVLQNRGATVDYLQCYQRQPPDALDNSLLDKIECREIDIITCSSNQALDNLFKLLPEGVHQALFDIPLLPISERMSEKAKDYGFKHIINSATNASDTAILAALCQYAGSEAYPHRQQ